MTNSLNTPIEALEYAYPFRVRRYAYRDGSGGAGQFRGGDGLIREVELLRRCAGDAAGRAQKVPALTDCRVEKMARPDAHGLSRPEAKRTSYLENAAFA